MQERIEGVMTTPDGYWRVEAVRAGKARWFRIWHATTLLQDRAALATVQRILGDDFELLTPAESGEPGVA